MPKHIRVYEGGGGEIGANCMNETHPFVPWLPLVFVSPLRNRGVS